MSGSQQSRAATRERQCRVVSYRACYFADTSSKLMFECFPCGIWRRQNTTFMVISLDIGRASKA